MGQAPALPLPPPHGWWSIGLRKNGGYANFRLQYAPKDVIAIVAERVSASGIEVAYEVDEAQVSHVFKIRGSFLACAFSLQNVDGVPCTHP